MNSSNRVKILPGIVLALLTAGLYFYPISQDLYSGYAAHTNWAAQMAIKKVIVMPHFLFHLETILIHFFSGFNFSNSGYLAAALSQGFSQFFIWKFLTFKNQESAKPISPLLILFLCFTLSFVGPLSLFSYPKLYLGFLNINFANSPTLLAMKPFALSLFFSALFLMERPDRAENSKKLVLCSFLCLVGGLAKPSFNLCFIPTVALWAFWKFSGRNFALNFEGSRRIGWILALLLPGIILILWQANFIYLDNRLVDGWMRRAPKSSLVFSPFEVMNQQTGSTARSILNGLMSFAFPAFAVLAYWKSAAKRLDLRLAWTCLAFALFIGYGFAEESTRKSAGVLFSCASIPLLLLMILSVDVVIKSELAAKKFRLNWRNTGALILYSLHFLSGAIWMAFLQRR